MSHAEPSLVEKVIGLHDALDAHGVRHAFGGALALAYYTLEPRTTADIDVDLTVDASEARRVLDVLPVGVAWSDDDLGRISADEQVRLCRPR